MSYRYLEHKPLDPQACKLVLQERIEVMRHQYEVAQTIIKAMAPFNGKAINKRIATAVQKALGEKFVVSWQSESALPRFYVWGAGFLSYDNRLVVNLNPHAGVYRHDDTIRAPSAEETPYVERKSPGNLWYISGYPAQIAALERVIETLPSRIAEYEAARQAFKAALAGLEQGRFFLIDKFAR